MSLYGAAWVGLAFFFSASCLASTCLTSKPPLSASLYVAAPEMLRPMKDDGCITANQVLAVLLQKKEVATPASVSAVNGYVPKTKDDNTPWRFDMNQNGKRMTAEQFDAWMKAKGIRVATGKAGSVPVEGSVVQ